MGGWLQRKLGWHVFFGIPSSLNDLNVLDMSATMEAVLKGKSLPNLEYVVNGNTYTTPNYLADGIYPAWTMFIKTLKHSLSTKDKRSSMKQEAVRKDIERAFGVLVARFHILKQHSLPRNRNEILMIMKACVIMHNMIVEARRDN
jgi:secreted protein with Ig-like and vWFA domain